jgi:hypothetical protein
MMMAAVPRFDVQGVNYTVLGVNEVHNIVLQKHFGAPHFPLQSEQHRTKGASHSQESGQHISVDSKGQARWAPTGQ